MCGIYVGHENMAHTGVQYDLPARRAVSIGTPYNHRNCVPNSLNELIVNEQSWKPASMGVDERYYCKTSNRLKSMFRNNLDLLFSKLSEIKASRETLKRSIARDQWTKLETIKNMSRTLGLDEAFVDKNILSIKTKNSFPINNSKIKISPELARVTGHILGDGGIQIIKYEGKYRVFYANNENSLLTSFNNDIKSIFGKIEIYSRGGDKDRVGELWLPTTVGIVLNKIIVIGKSKTKRVPEFILNCKDHLIIENFLQAIFDDEGYLYPKKNIIAISLVNLGLLSEIKYLLKKVGIKVNPIHTHKSKARSTMFYFNITGRENILNFYKSINFIHPVKNKKLSDLANKYGD